MVTYNLFKETVIKALTPPVWDILRGWMPLHVCVCVASMAPLATRCCLDETSSNVHLQIWTQTICLVVSSWCSSLLMNYRSKATIHRFFFSDTNYFTITFEDSLYLETVVVLISKVMLVNSFVATKWDKT